jgi:hypothetical protein
MNDSQFALNPIVTLNHFYTRPPFGRSHWRMSVADGDTRGIKAKTVYPSMAAIWPADECSEPGKLHYDPARRTAATVACVGHIDLTSTEISNGCCHYSDLHRRVLRLLPCCVS